MTYKFEFKIGNNFYRLNEIFKKVCGNLLKLDIIIRRYFSYYYWKNFIRKNLE